MVRKNLHLNYMNQIFTFVFRAPWKVDGLQELRSIYPNDSDIISTLLETLKKAQLVKVNRLKNKMLN